MYSKWLWKILKWNVNFFAGEGIKKEQNIFFSFQIDWQVKVIKKQIMKHTIWHKKKASNIIPMKL